MSGKTELNRLKRFLGEVHAAGLLVHIHAYSYIHGSYFLKPVAFTVVSINFRAA